MATTRWLVSLKRYLRQCGFDALRMAPRDGWIVLADDSGPCAAVLIGSDHFPPREALRQATYRAAPETRVGG